MVRFATYFCHMGTGKDPGVLVPSISPVLPGAKIQTSLRFLHNTEESGGENAEAQLPEVLVNHLRCLGISALLGNRVQNMLTLALSPGRGLQQGLFHPGSRGSRSHQHSWSLLPAQVSTS